MSTISECTRSKKSESDGRINIAIKKEPIDDNHNSKSQNKRKNSLDPELNSISSPKKAKTKSGPKSSEFRQNEKNSDKQNRMSSTIVEINGKIGPKCTKVGQKEENLPNGISSPTHIEKVKVGPKCAKFRQAKKHSPNGMLSPTKIENKVKVGPKCAKFRQREKSPPNALTKIKNKIKVGPKCAKFRQTEKSPINAHKKIEIKGKVGPKCAKFRQNEKKMSTNDRENLKTNLQYINETTSLSPRQTSTRNRIEPKCAKFRSEEYKSTSGSHSKHEEKNLHYCEERNFGLKPAVVSIGPKLPLPLAPRKTSLSREITQDMELDKSEHSIEHSLDQDHIVLKIYTCFKCNHKCTDPLFHDEHVQVCNTKRRSKPLTLPLQDSNKQTDFYKCEICTYKFKFKENLSNHLKQHGAEGFTCNICQMNIITLQQLQQHTLSEHKKMEKVFSCNICEYSSLNIHHLKDHMIKHNLDKYLYCHSCRHNYEDVEDIKNHYAEFPSHNKGKIKIEEDKRTAIIEIDKSESVSVSKGGKAIKKTAEAKEKSEANSAIISEISEEGSSHNCSTTSEGPSCSESVLKRFEHQIIARNGFYHCNGCIYKFVHLKNLMKHKAQHLKIKPFSCCNGSFISLSVVDLNTHVKENHDNDFKYACSMCPRVFAKNSLIEHMAKHVNDGLFCHQCRKNMETHDDLKFHISAKHNNTFIARYSCNECSYVTPLKSAFRRHRTLHTRYEMQSKSVTQVKNNEASGNESTGEENARKSDKQEIANYQSEPDLNKPVISCLVCSCKVSSAIALQEHMKYKHKQEQSAMEVERDPIVEEAFRCNKCTFKCTQPNLFIAHLKNAHKKRQFVCNVCRTSFSFFKLYVRHMKNHAACAVVYSCNECRFNSRKEPVITKHMRTHTLKRCPLCDYKTARSDSFKSHLETIHTSGNEHISTWDSDYESNTSVTGLPQSIISETSDSSSKNDVAKPHACCFCSYVTPVIDNLRSHMSVHFNNSAAPVNENTDSKTPKPSSTMGSLKNNTLSTKTKKVISTKLQRKTKPGKIALSKVREGTIPIYCCTRCNFKSKHRRSVAGHLLTKHNIEGAVRNRTITKIYVEEKRFEVQNRSKQNGSIQISQDDKKTIKGKRKRIKSAGVPIKCPSCDLQKLSLLAQLQHRKYGHMGFWQRSFSCKICGFRCADKANLAKHLKWKHKQVYEEHAEVPVMHESVKTAGNKLGRPTEDNFNEKQKLTVKKFKGRIIGGKCFECDFDILPEPAQYQHNKVGHDAFWGRYYSCNVCKMRFLVKGALSTHKLSHKTKYTCNRCNTSVLFKLRHLHTQSCKGHIEKDLKSKKSLPDQSTQDVVKPNRRLSSFEGEMKRNRGLSLSSDEDEVSKNRGLSSDEDEGVRKNRGLSSDEDEEVRKNRGLSSDEDEVSKSRGLSSDEGEENENRGHNSDEDESFVCGECDFVTKDIIKFSTHMFIHSGIPDD